MEYNMKKLKQLIKRIIKYPPPDLSNEFERNFIEKTPLLCDNRFVCKYEDIWPCLYDNTTNTGFDAHYLYHTAWAARILAKNKPVKHIDIGSTLYFISNVSAFIPFEFYDYRPVNINISNLDCKSGNIVSLPFSGDLVESISCMHVVEHIGLERYGDPFDPHGDLKAMDELKRVLKQNGSLLFVVPLGDTMRIQYNAHRIYTFEYIIKCFESLKLENFAFVTDDGQFLPEASENDVKEQKYGCGCFWFKK
jgi:SAM-dependent methyltransferase